MPEETLTRIRQHLKTLKLLGIEKVLDQELACAAQQALPPTELLERLLAIEANVERVNNFETLARRIYCSNSSLFSGLGGLIQAASGSLGGTGTFFTNLSGCAS